MSYRPTANVEVEATVYFAIACSPRAQGLSIIRSVERRRQKAERRMPNTDRGQLQFQPQPQPQPQAKLTPDSDSVLPLHFGHPHGVLYWAWYG